MFRYWNLTDKNGNGKEVNEKSRKIYAQICLAFQLILTADDSRKNPPNTWVVGLDLRKNAKKIEGISSFGK